MATVAPTETEAPAEAQETPVARDGSVAKDIHARVTKLLNGKKPISKKDAFAKIAAQDGRQEGTVSAAYYRVERANAGPKQTPTRTRAPRVRRSTLDEAFAQLDAAVANLKAVTKAEAQFIERVRGILG